jgi:glutaredoxin
VLYTRHRSWRCWRAIRLLRRMGYAFDVVDTTDDAELCASLERASGHNAAPYLFLDGRPVGDFNVIKALDRSGNFERLVRGNV